MYTASKEKIHNHGIRSLWKQWSDAAKGVTWSMAITFGDDHDKF